jgi:SET domain-containing protein 6
MSDQFQTRSEAFVSWLRNAGVDISPKIQLRDLRDIHAGRGVVATSPIEEDELLFRIPRSTILSVENSALPKLLPEAFEDLDPWPALTLVMIYEWCQGTRSNWKPYFDVLPTEFNTLMFWSSDELDQLQASAVRSKIGRESADAMVKETIYPILAQHGSLFAGEKTPDGRFSESDAITISHIMGSTIMAYAFDIEPTNPNKEVDEEGYVSEDEDEALPKGMVPLADMLNADADKNNARLFYEENCLSMKALKSISPGEEIFNDYGPLPRSDLLRRYGYITDNYAKYDVVEIPHGMVRETLIKEAGVPEAVADDRLKYLDEHHGLVDTGYDITTSDDFQVKENVSPELIVVIETLLLAQPEFDRLRAKEKLLKPEKFSLKGAQILHFLVKARTAQYATTLEQDKAESVTVPMTSPAHSKERRYAMARLVRIGEKSILRKAEIALSQLISQLSSSDGDLKRARSPENGTTKRRRMA